jgi:uncharacterized Zn finger protein
MTKQSMKTTTSNRETFTVPEGYEMEGTEFSISEIEVEDAPDDSGDGILTYELYHEDDVDGKELSKIVNELILDALKRQADDTN